MIKTQKSSDKGFEIKCLLKYHNRLEKAKVLFFSHHLDIQFESFLDQIKDRTLSQGSEHLIINYHKIRGINFPEISLKSQKVEIFVENDQLILEMTISDSYTVRQYLRPRVPQLNFFKNYKILETISTGGQGKVVKCLCNENKQIYTAKIVQQFEIFVKREVDNLKLLAQNPCKYVIQMFEYYEEQNLVILVFPYLCGGTLKKYMTYMKEHKKVLNVKKIMKQILTGLHFIHSLGLIHRDIKLDNIMVEHDEGENEIINIIDFGFSVRINSFDLHNERCGTVGYLAPEIANQESYDQRCDIYSLGQVFHILLTGNPIYGKGMKNFQIINLTKDHQLKIDTQKIICQETIELLSNMINQQSQRFTASKCLNHRYFGKMFFSEILNNLKSVLFRQKFQSRQ